MSKSVPSHLAIIMDGNGRWAEARGYPRAFGHIRGVSRIKPIVLEADRLGVKVLTLFAFSTENWKRPEAELGVLWKLLIKFLRREEAELHRNGVRLGVIGERERLPAEVRAVLDPAIERMRGNDGLRLNFAVSYGARAELVSAARKLAERVAAGTLDPSRIDEAAFAGELETADLAPYSDVDLLIRTSGEVRISNYLLWQSAYAELLFSEKAWPAFGVADLQSAIEVYRKRDRRYGGVKIPSSVE